MAKNGYCYLRLFKRQYRHWASQEFGKFPNARTIMRNLDNKVTRSDNRITWEAKGTILHVNKAMHNNPAELSTMILWAVQNPFGKIGGDAGPITHRHRRSTFDFETEDRMTDTEIEEIRSPASTVTQYQCHGAGPPASQATAASPVAPPPVPARSPARVAATVGSILPAVTESHHTRYGVGARMFEAMWSGQGCRIGRDRRGLGA